MHAIHDSVAIDETVVYGQRIFGSFLQCRKIFKLYFLVKNPSALTYSKLSIEAQDIY